MVAFGRRFGFAGWAVLIAAKARRQGGNDSGRPSKSCRRSGMAAQREGCLAALPRRIRAAFSKRRLVLPRGGGECVNTRPCCQTATGDQGNILWPEMRKPFDVLAEGLLVSSSRGDWTPLELFLAGVKALADQQSVARQVLMTPFGSSCPVLPRQTQPESSCRCTR